MSGDQREAWGSRIGLILAAAGNAVGIGNLLRFPGLAAKNGGGAFMVPYLISLLLFGLPMMWVAWTIGRYGGRFGHGSTPGMFDRLWRSPVSKYLGVLGVALPLVFCLFYTYIESWCLAYSYFSLTHDFVSTPERLVDLEVYLEEFRGNAATHHYFPGYTTALVFLLITLGLNIWVLYRGVAKGIELLAKIAMPLLFLFCLILAVRVFTIADQKGSAWEGLAYLWTPDFSLLKDAKVWMAAAGQIFFTLSIGMGSMECYASYLKEKDDIALNGLTTAATNEFVEVIFGSLIAIPAAAVYFGSDAATIRSIAEKGTFNIGMVSMPEVLRHLGGLEVFGTIWFLLLFFAAFTSSVAVSQPVIAFFEDECKLKKGAAVGILGLIWLLGSLPVIYFFKYGVFDELDFWAGTVGLVVFSAIEVVVFAWIFKMENGWQELHQGADIRVPRIFYYVTQYVTPICLIAVCCWWFQDAIAQDQLIAQPRLNYGIVDRGKYQGEFKAIPPDKISEEGRKLKQLKGSILSAIDSAARDLNAWAEVQLAADGKVEVKKFEGDPRLRGVLDEARLKEWLTLEKVTYIDNGTRQAAAAEVVLAIEGLYTAPYIWLTRVIILTFTILFMVMVRVVWKERLRTRPAA